MLEDGLTAGPPSGSLRHDEWLSPKPGSALDTLADRVFDATEGLRPAMKHRPRSDALERRRTIISNIVTNLAACVLLHGPACRLAIPTGNAASTRYDRADFPRQVISQCAVALEQAGFVFRYPGSRRGALTRLEASEELLEAIRHAGIAAADIVRTPGAETIILKAADQSGAKVPIDYADTRTTRRLRTEVERINAALASTPLTIAGRPQLPPHLVRMFQVPSEDAPCRFNAHGRLYGGWWIGMPKAERHAIHISGEPCANLDFTATLTMLAYAHAGAALPEDDPYAGIAGLETPSEAQRQGIKRGLSALYFRHGRMVRLPEEVKAGLGEDWTASRFTAVVSERHPAIAHLFGACIGLHLLHTESQIMVRTLLSLANAGVTALPIHDGLLCRASKADAAAGEMVRASRAIIGVALPLKVTLPQQLSAYGMAGGVGL